ncbi:hypothetical protein Q7P37_010255 [Cladosporium fusiforme]
MRISTFLQIAATLVAPIVDASSSIRNPISTIAEVSNATIQTGNHRIHALSHFDLTFNLRDELYVKFSLEPNHDILGEGAMITHLAPDGSVRHSEQVDRSQHKVFKGKTFVKRMHKKEDRWQQVGWARILVSKDGKTPLFEGAFSVDRDSHHIQSSHNYLRTRHWLDPETRRAEHGEEYMVVWRDSDITDTQDGFMHQDLKRGLDQGNDTASCHADGLTFNTHPDHPVYAAMRKRSESWGAMDFSNIFSLNKRQSDQTGGRGSVTNLANTIGDTQGCPTTRKVALVGVATDCTYTNEFNSTESARENVIQAMNSASAVWEGAFNISLGLANLTISDADCPGTPSQNTPWNQGCSDSVDIQDRLNLFSAWRGQQRDGNSHWTLLSTCNTQSAVGLAWLGQSCVNEAMDDGNTTTGNGQSNGQDTVSGANVVIRTQGAQEWQVIAHETGHTFGAVHDCDSSACSSQSDSRYTQQCCPLSSSTCDASGRFIMNPSSRPGIEDFSQCTIGNICSAIGNNAINTDCLSNNRDVETITGEQCGNGIVEGDEECDCGGEEGCKDNDCCDAKTCTFKGNSVCDDSNEDCCRNCQFASSGTVCRESSGDCDPQETCPGDSPMCPADEHTEDGEDCGDGLKCASGQCTSRDEQCKSVMGAYESPSACDSSSCVISCASPELGPNTCATAQQNFLDGTTCSGGGTCQNGRCRGSSVGGQVSSWIDDHKAIVIGVCSAVGGIILLAILGCCVRRCRRRSAFKKQVPGPPPPPPGGWQGWQGRPQMQQQQQGWGGSNAGWGAPPPPPPPAYNGRPRYM